MTKEWFKNILKCYPKAYYECLFDFKDKYPESWKDLMKQPKMLVEFFLRRAIHISVEEGLDPFFNHQSFKFKISSSYQLESDFEFIKPIYATWAGLEYAFMVLNFQIRRQQKKSQ